MTREECFKILMIIKSNYPEFTGMNNEIAIESWFEDIGEHDYSKVLLAVKKHRAVSPFVPKVSDINNACIDKREEIGEMQAWDMVARAASNSTYNSKQEFDKLPVEIREAIGTHVQLRNWAMVDIKEFNTVIQSNFMRAYREKAKHLREYAMLPSAVKAEMKSITEGLAKQLSLEGRTRPNENE